METEIARLRQTFDFDRAATARRLEAADRGIVAKVLYRRSLERCWRDSQLTSRETELLAWLAGNLGLPPALVESMNQKAAVEVFKTALAKAFADGSIDDREREHLESVAMAAGQTVASLMTLFLHHEGEQLIRSLFADIATGGHLARDDWKQFRETAEWLGVPRDRMLQAISKPAKQLVEHALVDARADGEVSEAEEKVITYLLSNIISDSSFRAYVRGQIAEAKEAQNLARGILPIIPAPRGVATRAGEVVHWVGSVEFVRVRKVGNETRTDTANGILVITDARAILDSLTRPVAIHHRNVLAHQPFGDCIEIRCPGKGAGRYHFGQGGDRAVVIWETAIGRANQTIVASDGKESRRRIPRDVRQRVWQKYGGRCADCNSDTYLEFDHIIPVAKGGGNSDTNVQLLCRRCNLSKSDNI
jgi:uncharacterized membrane protein YebE (DUF533 family)